jgi:hypothetical protein
MRPKDLAATARKLNKNCQRTFSMQQWSLPDISLKSVAFLSFFATTGTILTRERCDLAKQATGCQVKI